ncbi:MAG TPA: hypothetical protein VJB67_03125 [Patescibacteria group bacterium]|nr:hypothetical protein [Patescibacteria group bacterium]
MSLIQKIKIALYLLTNKKLKLNPDEMAFRRVYQDLLEQEKISVVFRPGKRECGALRGYCPRQAVTARVLDKIGADWAGLAPQFDPDFSKSIIIEGAVAKKIGEFQDNDFVGASPDVSDQKSLKFHLGLVYNIPVSQLTNDDYVTIVKFSYKK